MEDIIFPETETMYIIFVLANPQCTLMIDLTFQILTSDISTVSLFLFWVAWVFVRFDSLWKYRNYNNCRSLILQNM